MSRTNDDKDRKPEIPENDPSKAMDSKKEVEESNDNKIDQDFPGYPHYPAREDIMDQRTDSHRVDMDVESLSSNRNATGVSQRFAAGSDRQMNTEDRPRETDIPDEFSDLNPRTETDRKSAGSEVLRTFDSENAEIGIPQNVENDDLGSPRPGTDLEDEFSRADEPGENDVTPEERATLSNMSMPTNDEDNLRRSALDNTDFDGDALNEDGFGKVLSSADLDIPDETDETFTTAMGQGDEENKYYSLGGDRHEAQEEDPYSGPDPDRG
jgi:hypothetical protein